VLTRGLLAVVGGWLGRIAPARGADGTVATLTDETVTLAVGFALLDATSAVTTVTVIWFAVDAGRRARERDRREDAEALLRSGLIRAHGALGARIAVLASSPAALDRLVADAARGSGEELAALARDARVPADRVASAVLAAWRPIRSNEDCARVLLRMLADLAPDVTPDPDFTADVLERLRLETAQGRADGRAIRGFSAWMGVPRAGAARVVATVLAPVAGRPALHASPLGWSDSLADALADGYPAAIDARAAELDAEARRIDAEGDLGLFRVVAG
jgi:hypothetical protein